MTTEREKARRKAERERYKQLEADGKQWHEANPDACPDCSGRPGHRDWEAEGGNEHAPWCSKFVASSHSC